MTKRIGMLVGTGKVLLGTETISAVDYHLEVYQNFIENVTTTGSSSIPGMKRIEGTVREGSRPLPIGEVLKLITQEGHTLDFFVKNAYGTIAASGPLLRSNGEPVTF